MKAIQRQGTTEAKSLLKVTSIVFSFADFTFYSQSLKMSSFYVSTHAKSQTHPIKIKKGRTPCNSDYNLSVHIGWREYLYMEMII